MRKPLTADLLHTRRIISTLLVLLSLLLLHQPLHAQQPRTITGTVRDSASGNPIPRATIRVKGTKAGTAADDQGNFTIALPSAGSLLVISGTGYTPVELNPTGGAVNIRLVNVNQQLNDVVVVGYGTQKKATLTGAITTVNAKVFQDRGPIGNPFEALQGQAPGVIVTRTSGQPGKENWTFQIRGITSTNTAAPLVILDGVALSDNTELNTLNPSDIEKIGRAHV